MHSDNPPRILRTLVFRSGVDEKSIVEHGGKELAKQERHHVARNTAEKQDRQFAAGKINFSTEGVSVSRALAKKVTESGNDNQGQPNREADQVATPERPEESFLLYFIGTRDPASPTPTLADRVTIASDKAVSQVAYPAKRWNGSESTDPPGRRE